MQAQHGQTRRRGGQVTPHAERKQLLESPFQRLVLHDVVIGRSEGLRGSQRIHVEKGGEGGGGEIGKKGKAQVLFPTRLCGLFPHSVKI